MNSYLATGTRLRRESASERVTRLASEQRSALFAKRQTAITRAVLTERYFTDETFSDPECDIQRFISTTATESEN